MLRETWENMWKALRNIKDFYQNGVYEWIGEGQCERGNSLKLKINKEGYSVEAKISEKWTSIYYYLDDGDIIKKKYPTERLTQKFEFLEF